MRTLEKVIKNAIAADKYKSGVKEVLQSVKGSKLIIVSKSIDPEYRKKTRRAGQVYQCSNL
jgi:ribosomal protein L30E